MAGTYIFSVTFLTLTWMILCESFSLFTLLTGILISIGCTIFARIYLPLYKASNISIIKLVTYPIYMLGHIYAAAIATIKLILSDSQADIITVETELDNDFLKVLYSHSITLTPGTISIDLTEKKVTILRLHSLNISDTKYAALEKMERRLLKARRKLPDIYYDENY